MSEPLDLERIVREAVRQEIEPLERRVTGVETRLEAAVTVAIAQKMIDASVDGIQDRLREMRVNLSSIDVHLRQAEKAAQTVEVVNERLGNTGKLLDKLEDRVKMAEGRLGAVEDSAREQRTALFGDPTAKDAPPSLYRMVEELPARVRADFDMALASVHKQLEETRVRINEHTQFIERRRAIENRVLFTLQTVVKSPKMVAFILGMGGLTAGVIEFIKALAG